MKTDGGVRQHGLGCANRPPMRLPTSLRVFLVASAPLVVLACATAENPAGGAIAKKCDPSTCDPGLECIDNGTNNYCRKACTTNADCATHESCFAQAKASMQSYCVFKEATDGGIASVKDAAKSDGGGSCPALKNTMALAAACSACTGMYCCSAATACFGSSSTMCSSFLSCWTGCGGDQECQSYCQMDYPSGVAPYSTLASCQANYCGDSCSSGGI